MKITSITLIDGTSYETVEYDVKEIIIRFPKEFGNIQDGESIFEVIFSEARPSVKIPYHSVLLWR